MASNTIIQSSPLSSHMIRTYDVFVSFKGDTRNNFTDHLFGALHRKGIHFFKDNTKLKKGKQILPELMQAIEGSHILIVVFSKKYASSKWCLRELVKIAGYINVSGKHVLPIFYDVDPSVVRNQCGNYEKAFTKHEERYKEDKEKMKEVQQWKEVLTQVANLSGWHILNKAQDAEIAEIVREILKILETNFSRLPNDDLVGMEPRVKELQEPLLLNSNDIVRVIGICGMSGIGKTSLITTLYERISHQYDFHCFIDDVSKSFRDSGTLGVQTRLICQALNEKNLEIHNVSAGTHLVRTRLRYARVLIILDNVDQVDQLYKLALNRTCLGAGSRIIIISTDEHILREYKVDDVYQVQALNYNNAIKLFSINAFRDNYIMEGHFKEMTNDVLSYARGHPLAIKVLGSFLFGRDVSHWSSTLARLRVYPNKNIMDVLRVSYDGLHEMENEIFLDIACFFNEYSEQFVKEVLDFRGFYPEIGLRVLVEKSLITIERGFIDMHDLLVELGQYIVKEKSPKEPRKWSRLWDVKDLVKVMSDNMATKNLEAIFVRDERWLFPGTTIMRVDKLSEMSNLKLLNLDIMVPGCWKYLGNLTHLSNELGYLIWNGYPFDCLPSSFQPYNLVNLSLPLSKINKLWEGRKPLHNLRLLDLSECYNLIEVPDFGDAPNLEELNLEGCIKLRQINPSVGFLRKLTKLNLEGCKSLVKLPHFGGALNLEELDLEGCIQIKKIDQSIGHLRKLTKLNLKGCENLVNLPGLHSLECLNLFRCSKLFSSQSLDETWKTEHLKKLCVGEAPILSQSTSSGFFHSRTKKDSVGCLLSSPPCFPCMRELDLGFCNLLQIPDAIGNLCCLERLNLKGNNFTIMPSINQLSKLFYLNLEHCKKLKYLPELPSRTDLSPRKMNIKDTRSGGILVFNCQSLEEREHCSSMVYSWMKQIVKAIHQLQIHKYFDQKCRIESIIPGNEIPRWFNNQGVGMGNLFGIDASPNVMRDKNWIGIACCVALNGTWGNFSSMGCPGPNRIKLDFPVHGVGHLLKSDHIWLFYIPRTKFMFSCRFFAPPDVPGLKEFEILSPENDCNLKVKNYGYRWVYDEDLEPCNSTSALKPTFQPLKKTAFSLHLIKVKKRKHS